MLWGLSFLFLLSILCLFKCHCISKNNKKLRLDRWCSLLRERLRVHCGMETGLWWRNELWKWMKINWIAVSDADIEYSEIALMLIWMGNRGLQYRGCFCWDLLWCGVLTSSPKISMILIMILNSHKISLLRNLISGIAFMLWLLMCLVPPLRYIGCMQSLEFRCYWL